MRNMDNWQLQLRREGGKKEYREETRMVGDGVVGFHGD